MPGGAGRRGPYNLGTIPPSKEYYKCIIEKCGVSIRGDRIKGHFEKTADLTLLDQAKKMGNVQGEKHIKDLVSDDLEKSHTIFLLKEGYLSTSLPDYEAHCFKVQLKSKEINPMFRGFIQKPPKGLKKSESESLPSTSSETSELAAEQNVDINVVSELNVDNSAVSEQIIEETDNLPEDTRADTTKGDIDTVIKNQLGSNFVCPNCNKEVMEELALQVAQKVILLLNLEKENDIKKAKEVEECWKEHEDYLVCQPCFLYSKGLDVPQKLKKANKGSFGILKKESDRKKKAFVI